MNSDMVLNVDFAAMWPDYAGISFRTFMDVPHSEGLTAFPRTAAFAHGSTS